MSARHIWSIGLPGCGTGGGCDWAVKSAWSSLFGWPVAFFGLAYFCSVLVFWLSTARRGIWQPLLYAVRIGALVSIGYLVLMAGLGHFCVWCITTHVANLVWYSLIEFGSARKRSHSRPQTKDAIVAALVFLIVLIALKMIDIRQNRIARTDARKAAQESIAKIGAEEPLAADSLTSVPAGASDTAVPPKRTRRAFGGRYWTGAENAAVRIVIFHDYRCELCKEVEGQIDRLLATRKDLAVSIKQWPFDSECNPNIIGENVHPGACLAARYAEAAGLVGGDSAFWQMHRWIMADHGEATLVQIEAQVRQMGLDWQKMQQAVQGRQVDSVLAADIQDGLTFGIKFTPMLFVNGYELQGWQSAGAIPAAVQRAAEFARINPKRDDQPEAATEREFNQWLVQPMTRMQIRRDDHVRGPLGAPAAVIMYGDISDPYNGAAYELLRPLIEDTSRVCFIFRVFPLQAECNDMVKRKINDRACEAARILEASGLAGGPSAYWRTILWLMNRRGNLPDSLRTAVTDATGIDPQGLLQSMNDPAIDGHIGANVESAKQLGVDTSPTIFINGRKVANWRTPGLLKKIISHLTGS